MFKRRQGGVYTGKTFGFCNCVNPATENMG